MHIFILFKRTAFVLILFFLAHLTQAQDLIVTKDGDSLNCKIMEMKDEMLYFTFKDKNEERSSVLPLLQVKYYRYNYYSALDEKEEKPEKKEVEKTYSKFRIAAQGGWSYRLGRYPDDISQEYRDHISGLKSGYSCGLDFSYYFSEHLGFGFKYHYHGASSESKEITVNDVIFYKPKENVSIHFAGLLFSSRFSDAKKKNYIFLNVGFGYMRWDDALGFDGYTLVQIEPENIVLSRYKAKLYGNTVGASFDFGYDINLSKHFAIGFQISCIVGVAKYVYLSDGFSNQYINLGEDAENLSQFNLSIGLRFK